MKTLGAIIAGGKSTRFGSDKGSALLHGKALIDHVADGLRAQVALLVIAGRDWPTLPRVDDWPSPDLGPLGGLCGALRFAAANGFDAVISAGCDVLPVWKADLESEADEGCYLKGHYLFGRWPVSLATQLSDHLSRQTDYSIRGWIAASRARPISATQPYFNLNTRAELEAYERRAAIRQAPEF